MANTSRRYIDKNGKMFIPMNVEGGTWNEHFITTPKLICIAVILFSGLFIGLTLKDSYSPLSSYIILYSIWVVISMYLLRFLVFEEKYYYKMYKQLKTSEITTPALFWDIASIRDNSDGAVLTFSDAKLGVIIRLDRDTITGKHPDFKETHYDAISDFYKEIMLTKYNFVQLNIMEQAGKDPRLEELDKLVYKNDNPNIRKLMELEVGYIKNITHHTLYESEYIMIYTSDLSKFDSIISDAIDIVYKVLDGAYIGYKVLKARDIIEFVKEEYGVKYFNYTEATLAMFKEHGIHAKNPFELSKIIYSDGEVQTLTQKDILRINKLASDVSSGDIDISKISLKNTLCTSQNDNKLNNKIEFVTLSEGFKGNGMGDGSNVSVGVKREKVKAVPFIKHKQVENNTNKDNDLDDEFIDF